MITKDGVFIVSQDYTIYGIYMDDGPKPFPGDTMLRGKQIALIKFSDLEQAEYGKRYITDVMGSYMKNPRILLVSSDTEMQELGIVDGNITSFSDMLDELKLAEK